MAGCISGYEKFDLVFALRKTAGVGNVEFGGGALGVRDALLLFADEAPAEGPPCRDLTRPWTVGQYRHIHGLVRLETGDRRGNALVGIERTTHLDRRYLERPPGATCRNEGQQSHRDQPDPTHIPYHRYPSTLS